MMQMTLFRNGQVRDLCQLGFTLIEVLVALVIISVSILALGGFSLGVVSSGQLDRERLTAVHLAEQTLEFWQNEASDFAPKISTTDCLFTAGDTVPSTPISVSCIPKSGARISYTIIVEVETATAPLPTNPNIDAANPLGTNPGAFVVRTMVGDGTVSPTMKIVTVSWSHKGKSRSVYLTALAVR